MRSDSPRLPVIRTAMQMSRRTVKTDKGSIRLPVEIPSFTESSNSDVPVQTCAVSALKAPLPLSNESSMSSNPSHVSSSPYLDPIPRRKLHWGQFKQKHAEKLYENWERDECRLESVSVDAPLFTKNPVFLESRSDTHALTLHFPAHKPVLFRPRQRKFSHLSYLSPPQRPAKVTVKSQRSRHHLPTPPQPVQVETESHMNASHREEEIYPVLKLTQIDSCELESSLSDPGDVLESIRERRKFKSREHPPIPPVARPIPTQGISLHMKYTEESAQVLGDTRSLLRRRSERMIIPARLLRDV